MYSPDNSRSWFVEEWIDTQGGGFWIVRHVVDDEAWANRYALGLKSQGKTTRIVPGY